MIYLYMGEECTGEMFEVLELLNNYGSMGWKLHSMQHRPRFTNEYLLLFEKVFSSEEEAETATMVPRAGMGTLKVYPDRLPKPTEVRVNSVELQRRRDRVALEIDGNRSDGSEQPSEEARHEEGRPEEGATSKALLRLVQTGI